MNAQSIREYARQIDEFHRRIHETFAHRSEGATQWKAWKDACHAWHTYESPLDGLWTLDARAKIEGGEGSWRDDAITFLEEDPWYFRSGYLKQRLITSLKRAPLTPTEQRRVRGLLLRVVDSRHRREFRDFCRLAIAVVNDWLREELQRRLLSPNEGMRL